MEKPNSLKHLAELLTGQKYQRITSLTDLIGEDATDFFDNIKKEEVSFCPDFPRYIPVVRESVSVKKHDYNLITHIVFWLADGQPYIYTPPPTIEHVRHGMRNQKLKRGAHLMIPHNCHAFDLLTIREGHCNQTDTTILNLTIHRYGNI